MIKIKGKQRKELLQAMSRKRIVPGNGEVVHDYTKMFHCNLAKEVGDELILNTHSESNDATILRKTAAIMDLSAEVEVV